MVAKISQFQIELFFRIWPFQIDWAMCHETFFQDAFYSNQLEINQNWSKKINILNMD